MKVASGARNVVNQSIQPQRTQRVRRVLLFLSVLSVPSVAEYLLKQFVPDGIDQGVGDGGGQ
jgi:hypothetical protein